MEPGYCEENGLLCDVEETLLLPNFRASVAEMFCKYRPPIEEWPVGIPSKAVVQHPGTRFYLCPKFVLTDLIIFQSFSTKKLAKKHAKSLVTNQKCELNLCFSNKKNCFYNFHHK